MILSLLLLAHLLGDFLLQPKSWVQAKERDTYRSIYLYAHVVIHTLLVLLFLPGEFWWFSLVIGVTHYFIDLLKLRYQTHRTKIKWFFWDQALHLLVILLLCVGMNQWNLSKENLLVNTPFILGAVFVTIPCSVIVKSLISNWTPVTPSIESTQSESLVNAGHYIGLLERLLVYIFIVTGHWEGVGFMIAAKSVFRFSDLAQARQRKLTEYVLIGTLLSFGLSVVSALLVIGIYN